MVVRTTRLRFSVRQRALLQLGLLSLLIVLFLIDTYR